ncbi:hypothetical protein Tco_1393325 [Tanacetum coccineum]
MLRSQLLTSLCDNFKNSASTSNSRTLPSQTVTNPRQQINAITTRSDNTLEEPSIPLVPTPDVLKPQKEPEQNPETSTEKVQNLNLENTAQSPPFVEEDSIFHAIPQNQKQRKPLILILILIHVQATPFKDWIERYSCRNAKIQQMLKLLSKNKENTGEDSPSQTCEC